MSSKKKQQVYSTCEKCGCTLLVQDVQRHNDVCSSPPEVWEMSFIKQRCLMKGFVVQLEKWEEFLPPNASGWLRRHSVFIHPQAMEILGVTPRQPVRVSTPFKEYVGVLWPCKEVLSIFVYQELFRVLSQFGRYGYSVRSNAPVTF
ncbi:hypothetical protein NECAME_00270 [Necator americanus]|uniref:Uncharacterized protein n=1 Tax=Necator americanus TaxID=51031 RepID=W2TJW6_NECAM|nr:hypothetical protein NECAME_00270 [Necator americanus]ETN81919.1 hypothetical protein NECAME_00270 [Necator americanus]